MNELQSRLLRNTEELPTNGVARGGKLSRLEPHDTIAGDPESIVSIDWSEFWKEEDNTI